jgi:hypothetical protein
VPSVLAFSFALASRSARSLSVLASVAFPRESFIVVDLHHLLSRAVWASWWTASLVS